MGAVVRIDFIYLASTALDHLLDLLLSLQFHNLSLALGLLASTAPLIAVKHRANSLVPAPIVWLLLQRLFAEGTDQALVQPLGEAVSVEDVAGRASSL